MNPNLFHWALATVFDYLKDTNCVPEDDLCSQLVASMITAINLQVKASFSAVAFLQQKRRETLVSHLPSATHACVKHGVLHKLKHIFPNTYQRIKSICSPA